MGEGVGDRSAGPDRAARAVAIGEFATALRELRRSAGDPSFREMAGRSRAISHTTLHEAAQGNRLPSWATTVEFVRACGADPSEYRARWEQADRVVRIELSSTAPPGPDVPDAAPEPPAPAEPVEEVVLPSQPAPDRDSAPVPAPRGRRRRAAIAVGAAVVVAAGVIVTAIVASGDDSPHRSAKSGPRTKAPALSAADCPVHPTNPPAAPPAHSGDASEFVADRTLPDCSHVDRNSTVTKVWRLRNVGTLAWKGYYLHRLEQPQSRDQCQTVSDVPIPETAPGETVDVRVQVITPPVAAFCFVRFKMMDADGRVLFPGSRPVNFQLVVD